jgi:lipid-binding SYLF domain-containing protein
MSSRLRIRISLLALLVLGATTALAKNDLDRAQKLQLKRDAINTMAEDAMKRLFMESPAARELADDTVAYAVFDNFKVSVLVSGGTGVGVAVNDQTGSRTYMRMGTGGIGLGLGGQSYQMVFMFEDLETFDRFVNKGWQADASANAVAGTSGKNYAATFTNGLAVFQLTNKGLLAQADIAGTKYWKSKKLNRQ